VTPPNDEADAPLYRTEIRFNSIYVLESLRPGEAKTGEELYDAVIYPGKSVHDDMHAQFERVPTKRDLVRQLTLIAQAAQQANHRPIIHIEAHGGSDGIQLTDGDYVPWKQLIPLFTRINIACKNNLVVVAISCFGWGLTAALMPSDRAPVMMLVGPPDAMTAAELLEATRRFYHSLTSEFDMNQALEAMNDHRPFAQWPIRPATAEILFCRVFRQYLAEEATPEALRVREDALVTASIAGKPRTELDIAALRIAIRLDLANHRAVYDRYRRTFLMLDLFPGDQNRFGLTYDLCIPTSEIQPTAVRAERIVCADKPRMLSTTRASLSPAASQLNSVLPAA
jgi:hypothetical protein